MINKNISKNIIYYINNIFTLYTYNNKSIMILKIYYNLYFILHICET